MWHHLTPTDKKFMSVSMVLLFILIAWMGYEADQRDKDINFKAPYVVRLTYDDQQRLTRIEAKLDSLLAAHNWAFNSK